MRKMLALGNRRRFVSGASNNLRAMCRSGKASERLNRKPASPVRGDIFVEMPAKIFQSSVGATYAAPTELVVSEDCEATNMSRLRRCIYSRSFGARITEA